MPEKKGINLENLKFVDANEVPTKVRYTPYRELLKRIRKGKALVLSENDININTARAGIKRLQKKGEFKRITTVQRRLASGEQVLYVVNPSDEVMDVVDGQIVRRARKSSEEKQQENKY